MVLCTNGRHQTWSVQTVSGSHLSHKASLNLFDLLPPEVNQGILSLLPNVASVNSAVLTCTSLYQAFRNSEWIILTKVLKQLIHPDTAFEAFLASRASILDREFKASSDPWNTEKAREVLRLYDGERSSSLIFQWTLRDALALSKLHEHACFFAGDFASSALSIDLKGASLSGDEMRPSASEMHRIQRTFYRFEIYCNLFRVRERRGCYGPRILLKPEQRIIPTDQQMMFFRRFPPWENEQLACVRDFLFNQVSVPFNDVAAHCVEWAKYEFDDYDYLHDWESPENARKEHLLSHGLGYIRQLITTNASEERLRLLNSPHDTDYDFLFAGLEARYPHHNVQKLSDYSELRRAGFLNQFRAADIDIGPRKAWLWAHIDSDAENFYNDLWRGHRFLRMRGYVMWDLARWERWGSLDEEWQENPPAEYDPERDHGVDCERQRKEMRESFHERHEICKRGGRGWWAPGDESRVQWSGGKVPNDWPPKPRNTQIDLKVQETAQEIERVHTHRRELPSDYQGWVDFFKWRKA